jgi:hypothetical protein
MNGNLCLMPLILLMMLAPENEATYDEHEYEQYKAKDNSYGDYIFGCKTNHQRF